MSQSYAHAAEAIKAKYPLMAPMYLLWTALNEAVGDEVANIALDIVMNTEGCGLEHQLAEHEGPLLPLGCSTIISIKSDATPLIMAAMAKRPEAVQALINAGANVHASANTFTALHLAADGGDLTSVKMLFEAGARVNEFSKPGNPLCVALAASRLEVAKFLISETPTDVNYQSEFSGRTALHWATNSGMNQADKGATIVKMLLQEGSNVATLDKYEFSPLHTAVSSDYYKASVALLAEGASVSYRCGKVGVLNAAVSRNRSREPTIIQALLDCGADINDLVVGSRTTCLHNAVNEADVMVLVSEGASIEAVDSTGRTPLHTAAAHGYIQTVKALIKLGAKLSAVDENGQTPLHNAVLTYCTIGMARLLVHSGARLDIKNRFGWTPLACVGKGGVQYGESESDDLTNMLRYDDGAAEGGDSESDDYSNLCLPN